MTLDKLYSRGRSARNDALLLPYNHERSLRHRKWRPSAGETPRRENNQTVVGMANNVPAGRHGLVRILTSPSPTWRRPVARDCDR